MIRSEVPQYVIRDTKRVEALKEMNFSELLVWLNKKHTPSNVKSASKGSPVAAGCEHKEALLSEKLNHLSPEHTGKASYTLKKYKDRLEMSLDGIRLGSSRIRIKHHFP